VVSKFRRIPIETNEEAVFQVKVGQNGVYKQVNGSSIPPGWREAGDILRQSLGLAVILGDVNVGKSTLSTYLANTCFDHGIRTSIIDGDIGQADIGPPTTTSSSTVSNHILGLQDLKPEQSHFIGDTSPSGVAAKLVQSITHLKEEIAARSEVMILNTDGWVRDEEAVSYKLQLLNSLQPNLVLGLSSNNELNPILEHHQYPTLKLEASPFARTRTKEERKNTREEGYRRFFQNPKHLDLNLNTIKLRTFNKSRQQRIDQDSTQRGTLAGLLDGRGMLLSIGRIARIQNGIVRVTTTTEERPRIVELGAVILSSRFAEVGYEP
jgi:polynucleotide 5'-hydroxyl-kinase GRC3/NOL9